MTLAEDILAFLDKQKTPVSVHDIIVALNNYDVYEVKTELWHLSAEGKLRFDWDWKITRSNDGTADY